jgi:hypothetical protein
MNRILLALLFLLPFAAGAQDTSKYMNDSAFMLPEAKVTAQWLNDTDRYRYNQMKFYVTTILPYLDASTQLFKDVNDKVNEKGISKKQRRKYVNSREDEMRTKFEDKIKQLNVTQGTLLVKLICRQTELNLYKILQEFKNPLTAVKWQTWARLNGLNLDRRYNPKEEKDLENIMEELGYPLPGSYTMYTDKG